jgi:hypothetical protein
LKPMKPKPQDLPVKVLLHEWQLNKPLPHRP